MDKILTLNNVYYEKDSFKLTDLSFSLYEKDIVGLIGENGAGKTTLFRLIFNDLKPKSGEIVLF
ncbi:ATP-binding cassette domain-containing protein, partial [Enterococcus faecalis]|nr:ATP-binding cassette domain-containing protein [Enterococcus faecalis]